MRGVKHDFVRVAMHAGRLTPIFEPANIPRQAVASTRNLGRIGRGTRGFDGPCCGTVAAFAFSRRVCRLPKLACYGASYVQPVTGQPVGERYAYPAVLLLLLLLL